jgi:hypothetical protein
MPRPRKDLDAFRDEIERRIASKHTHRQIRSWLAGEGLIISKDTLQSRCVAWEATRRTRTVSLESLNSRNERILRNGYILMLIAREVNELSAILTL